MLVITRWLNTIQSHDTTIFLWFSYGFPQEIIQKKIRSTARRLCLGELLRNCLARLGVAPSHHGHLGVLEHP